MASWSDEVMDNISGKFPACASNTYKAREISIPFSAVAPLTPFLLIASKQNGAYE
jgi:hypothetical protein